MSCLVCEGTGWYSELAREYLYTRRSDEQHVVRVTCKCDAGDEYGQRRVHELIDKATQRRKQRQKGKHE